MANANLQGMMDTITERATAYAKAYNEGEKRDTLKELKLAANRAVDEYNLALSKSVYRMWAKEGDPIRTAVRSLYVDGAKKLSFKTDDDGYMTVILGDNRNYEANLPQMQATLGVGAFHDPKWFSKCEKLAFIVANALNEHLNGSPMFEYEIAKASREFSFPKGIDPLSDDGVVYALQEVIDSILYIDDVDNPGTNLIKTRMMTDKRGVVYSADWQYIRESMTANGGLGKINVCNTGKFTSYILHVMHLILTNGNIGLESSGTFVMPQADKDDAAESHTDGKKQKKTKVKA